MNTLEKIVIGIAVLLGVGAFTFSKAPILKGVEKTGSYSVALSYSTSSITNSVAKSLVSRATSSRVKAEVCHVSGGIVWLYQQATSTGVAVSMGTPIFSTTTATNAWNYDVCKNYDILDPYTGQVWGISDVTSTVSINLLQS